MTTGPGPKPKPDDVRGTSTVWKPIVTDSSAEDKRGYTKGGHLVMYDDRETWNWQTHYKHIYVPQPQVRSGSCSGIRIPCVLVADTSARAKRMRSDDGRQRAVAAQCL